MRVSLLRALSQDFTKRYARPVDLSTGRIAASFRANWRHFPQREVPDGRGRGRSLDERLRAIEHRFGIYNLIETIAGFSVAWHIALAATHQSSAFPATDDAQFR
jgi:hypothetical protein